VLLGIAAFFVGFAILGGVLGDPGSGGDTPQFERGKQLALILSVAFPVAGRCDRLSHPPVVDPHSTGRPANHARNGWEVEMTRARHAELGRWAGDTSRGRWLSAFG
jgi:hypothetical protein